MNTGSVTKASEELFVTQPAISRLIADLEAYAGYKLFERHKRQMIPTNQARTLLAEVEQSYRGLDRIDAVLKEIGALNVGKLRIITMPALSGDIVSQATASFARKFPNITIELEVRNSPQVLKQVAEHQFDIGFAEAEARLPGLKPNYTLTTSCACILPAGHRLTQKSAITPADLDGETFISWSKDSKLRKQIDSVFDRERVNRKLQIEASLSATLCSLVRQGLGLALVDTVLESTSDLETRSFEPTIQSNFHIYVPPHNENMRLVRAFIEILELILPDNISLTEN